MSEKEKLNYKIRKALKKERQLALEKIVIYSGFFL